MNLIRWMLSKEIRSDPFLVRWGRWCLGGLVWATAQNLKPMEAEAISRGNAQGCPRSVHKVNSLGMAAKTKWNTTRGGNQFSKPRGGRLEQMISWMSLSGEMKVIRGEFSNADFRWCPCHHPRVRHWPGEAEVHFHSKLMTTQNIDLFKNIC